MAQIACGNLRGVEALSQSMRPAKSVVFAGEVILRGNLRGVEALSQPMRPAKSVVFAGEVILRGKLHGVKVGAIHLHSAPLLAPASAASVTRAESDLHPRP